MAQEVLPRVQLFVNGRRTRKGNADDRRQRPHRKSGSDPRLLERERIENRVRRQSGVLPSEYGRSAFARTRKVQVNEIVARFARNTVDSLNYVRKLKAKGIGVYFEEQALDSLKTENEMAIGLYSVLAQAESENISANVRWGIQQRMKSGTFKFRYNLLGYRKGENGEPEIVEEEARYIRDIFNMYLNGCSLDQIKDYLESEGVKTKTGKTIWSKSLLKNILSNERYCGDLLMQKTYTENCITKKVKKNRGEMPKYLVKNNHPAIVTQSAFSLNRYDIYGLEVIQGTIFCIK